MQNKRASIESALLSNPFVPRAGGDARPAMPETGGIPKNILPWTAAGLGVGGLVGALRAEKGKKLRGAVRGAGVGAMGGLLGSIGANAAAQAGDIEMAYHGTPYAELSGPAKATTLASPYAAGGLSALLGAYLGDKAITHGEETAKKHDEDKKKQKSTTKKGTAAMALDRTLLTKAAKVYEAAEAVDGMKPKEVYESHKKCAPGEFGMHKEGRAKLQQMLIKAARQKFAETETIVQPGQSTVTTEDTSPGGIEAAMARAIAPRMGSAIGGKLGLIAGLLGGGAYGAYDPGAYAELDEKGNPTLKRRSRLMGALRGGLGGGLLGNVGGGIAGLVGGQAYADAKYGPRETSTTVKASALDPKAMGYGAAGGGLAGALGGGLAGLLSPGEEEDENGRVRRRGRFGAALRGALGGGALGAVGGAGLGAVAPTMTTDLANAGMSKATEFGNMIRNMFAGKSQANQGPEPISVSSTMGSTSGSANALPLPTNSNTVLTGSIRGLPRHPFSEVEPIPVSTTTGDMGKAMYTPENLLAASRDAEARRESALREALMPTMGSTVNPLAVPASPYAPGAFEGFFNRTIPLQDPPALSANTTTGY